MGSRPVKIKKIKTRVPPCTSIIHADTASCFAPSPSLPSYAAPPPLMYPRTLACRKSGKGLCPPCRESNQLTISATRDVPFFNWPPPLVATQMQIILCRIVSATHRAKPVDTTPCQLAKMTASPVPRQEITCTPCTLTGRVVARADFWTHPFVGS